MTRDQKECLLKLNEISHPDGEVCVNFAYLMSETGFDRKTVRRNVRALARKGLAEYFRGLMNEYGELGGAGYCITKDGRELAESLEVE